MASRTGERSRRRSASGGLVTVLTGGAVVVADQLTKSWALGLPPAGRHVLGTLWLVLTYNPGAAFGLGKGATPVVEAAVIVLIAALVVAARRNARRGRSTEALALGLLVGGALSNLGDRVFRTIPGHPGAVVDWIDVAQVGRHEYWPVFNVADACVVVGAILLAWRLSRRPHPG